MKIRFDNTDLFEIDLRNKLLNAIEDQMDNLLKDKIYKLHLNFNEELIKDHTRIENFKIPEESLPKYKQGIVLSNEDKLYAILSYQIDTVMKAVEEHGIVLRHCDITGSPFVPMSNMEFSLEEYNAHDEEIRTKKGNIKKIKMPKVIGIMPSLTGFAYK